MPCPSSCPSKGNPTSVGSSILIDMDSVVFYDDLGKDMRVEPIPEDMADLAAEYKEKLIDAVFSLTMRSRRCIWKARRSPPTVCARSSARRPSAAAWFLGPLRYVVQEQRRAEAARCRCRFPALSAGCSARCRREPQDGRRGHSPRGRERHPLPVSSSR